MLSFPEHVSGFPDVQVFSVYSDFRFQKYPTFGAKTRRVRVSTPAAVPCLGGPQPSVVDAAPPEEAGRVLCWVLADRKALGDFPRGRAESGCFFL